MPLLSQIIKRKMYNAKKRVVFASIAMGLATTIGLVPTNRTVAAPRPAPAGELHMVLVV